MARYPAARWRPVARYQPGGSSCQPMSRYDGGIDHTYVGSPSSDAAFAHFNTSGNPIPHFMVFRDGSIDQYVDTKFRSSACLDGNLRLITWETADGFPSLWSDGQAPKDTAEMVKAKARLMLWLHRTHDIPLERMPSSKPTARGMGWHRLGIDGNFEQKPGELLGGRVSGGERWSTSFGKTCPTTRRIHQFVDETLPAADALNDPQPKARATTGVIVQSGHNLASGDQLTHALDAHKVKLDDTVTARDSKVILLTEQAAGKFDEPLAQWAKDNDWHLFHPSPRGPRECAILSSRPIKRTTYFQLTTLTLDPKVTNRTAPLFVTAAQPKGDDWFAVWHSPAHNQGLKPGNRATRVYRAAVAGLKRWRMRVTGKVTIGGDFNGEPLQNRRLADLFRKWFPNMRFGGTASQDGTLGNRVIDGVMTNRRIVRPAKTLPPQPGFDHRPVLVVLG